MATKGDAISIVSWLNPTAIAFVAKAGKRFTIRVINSMMLKKTRKICAKNIAFLLDLVKAGINACVNAPSAKIRRNKFGSLKAMKNISL